VTIPAEAYSGDLMATSGFKCHTWMAADQIKGKVTWKSFMLFQRKSLGSISMQCRSEAMKKSKNRLKPEASHKGQTSLKTLVLPSHWRQYGTRPSRAFHNTFELRENVWQSNSCESHVCLLQTCKNDWTAMQQGGSDETQVSGGCDVKRVWLILPIEHSGRGRAHPYVIGRIIKTVEVLAS
jgi:hypothetical protein